MKIVTIILLIVVGLIFFIFLLLITVEQAEKRCIVSYEDKQLFKDADESIIRAICYSTEYKDCNCDDIIKQMKGGYNKNE